MSRIAPPLTVLAVALLLAPPARGDTTLDARLEP
ncbi:hypothetical protein ElP_07390 [Tautonia plasticadhaerens]|uniref:Uncharacterized protein n=1 Tax=Tautonia plasticadhaerens TaxID=2527974 RepID=A0A518GWD7_9BACT|nr:hypothetical protein ElP_07390 [Tautonia plasticadhaerens]